ncbi:hypothetical protein DPMN_099739 [Dreissena polymorpha]|uniref:t-SNARE coiled-coil homology domain-containing protein n=1 Tax=Dreissena polymorpha TaxID=45954 RepID=A0A9D4LG27_DREPO|nr:hypothetical protein DPMN_099739 [Dreissena polymorpha]
MDARFTVLEGLERKMDNFEKEFKKLWLHMDTVAKDSREKVDRVENKIDSVGIDIEGARRRISDLEQVNKRLRDDMNYVQSQSMRNNLILRQYFRGRK